MNGVEDKENQNKNLKGEQSKNIEPKPLEENTTTENDTNIITETKTENDTETTTETEVNNTEVKTEENVNVENIVEKTQEKNTDENKNAEAKKKNNLKIILFVLIIIVGALIYAFNLGGKDSLESILGNSKSSNTGKMLDKIIEASKNRTKDLEDNGGVLAYSIGVDFNENMDVLISQDNPFEALLTDEELLEGIKELANTNKLMISGKLTEDRIDAALKLEAINSSLIEAHFNYDKENGLIFNVLDLFIDPIQITQETIEKYFAEYGYNEAFLEEFEAKYNEEQEKIKELTDRVEKLIENIGIKNDLEDLITIEETEKNKTFVINPNLTDEKVKNIVEKTYRKLIEDKELRDELIKIAYEFHEISENLYDMEELYEDYAKEREEDLKSRIEELDEETANLTEEDIEEYLNDIFNVMDEFKDFYEVINNLEIKINIENNKIINQEIIIDVKSIVQKIEDLKDYENENPIDTISIKFSWENYNTFKAEDLSKKDTLEIEYDDEDLDILFMENLDLENFINEFVKTDFAKTFKITESMLESLTNPENSYDDDYYYYEDEDYDFEFDYDFYDEYEYDFEY